MKQISIEGTVPDSFTNQKEFYLKIAQKDIERAKAFYRETSTNFRSGGIAVRKQEIVRACKAGDYIRLNLNIIHRKDGDRVGATNHEMIKPAIKKVL
jgi:hypothetical protein